MERRLMLKLASALLSCAALLVFSFPLPLHASGSPRMQRGGLFPRTIPSGSAAAVERILPRRGNGAGLLDIANLTRDMAFDDVDGGVWKQGWDLQDEVARRYCGGGGGGNPEGEKSCEKSNADAVAPHALGKSLPERREMESDNLLQVFVVPFSHCDPGWIRTYDEYYEKQTRGILNTVVKFLKADKRRRFVWAEMSFFSRWWLDHRTTEEQRRDARTLLTEGRLEMVTGGWVMNDEAVVSVASSVLQLTHGHAWMQKHVGMDTEPRVEGSDGGAFSSSSSSSSSKGAAAVSSSARHLQDQRRPTHGWSIDPFGHSPTMAILNKNMGFEAMAINRINYRVRKELDFHRNGEFFWRPTWRGRDDAQDDIFTHLFPFFIYDMPHTCGPNPSVCSLYDYHKSSTPWGGRPEPISNRNIKAQASKLVDQWRRKASLFRTRNVIVPLGDDFRYADDAEASVLFQNHQLIHDMVNNPDEGFNVRVRFATYREYATAVLQTPGKDKWPALAPAEAPSEDLPSFPIVRGDFFTFCDVREECWSGYFSTRPFHKDLSRATEASIFAGDLFLSAMALKKVPSGDLNQGDFSKHLGALHAARAHASLFLHHDGITGTAKAYVVTDYAKMLQDGRSASIRAAAFALRHLLDKGDKTADDRSWSLALNDGFPENKAALTGKEQARMPSVSLHQLNERKSMPLVVANPTEHGSEEGVATRVVVVRLTCGNLGADACASVAKEIGVSSLDRRDNLHAQLLPVWREAAEAQADVVDSVSEKNLAVSETMFDLAVAVPNVPALGAVALMMHLSSTETGTASVSSVEVISNVSPSGRFLGRDFQSDSEGGATFSLANQEYSLGFDRKTGMLNSLQRSSGDKAADATDAVRMDENYLYYSTRLSGAYIFVPDGEAKDFSGNRAQVVVVRGSVLSETITVVNEVIVRRVRLLHGDNSGTCKELHPEVSHFVSMDDNRMNNHEVVMRLKSSLDTQAAFERDFPGHAGKMRPAVVTDLNGLSFQRRRTRFSDLSRQGNFYPATAALFLEDETSAHSPARARFGILLGSGAAVSAQCNGCAEVMLDRRVTADDNKGLGEGVVDNVHATHLRSRWILEFVKSDVSTDVFWPTVNARSAMRTLDRPLVTLLGLTTESATPSAWQSRLKSQFTMIPRKNLSPEVELLGVRLREANTVSEPEVMLQVARPIVLSGSAEPGKQGVSYLETSDMLLDAFGGEHTWKVSPHTLTFLSKLSQSPTWLEPGGFSAQLIELYPADRDLGRASANAQKQPAPLTPAAPVTEEPQSRHGVIDSRLEPIPRIAERKPDGTLKLRRMDKMPRNLTPGRRARSHSETMSIAIFAVATILVPVALAMQSKRLALGIFLACISVSLFHFSTSH